jgi:hypothetical protein
MLQFYVHLQSDLQFRSLVEVYGFIVDGKRPTTGLSKATKEVLKKIDGVTPLLILILFVFEF